MASRRAAVAPMVERVLAAVSDAGFDEEQRDDLAVALSEALSNAAVHGNKLRPRSHVTIRVEVTPGVNALIVVRDSGDGFDQTGLPDPSDPARILVPGGRGVFLMRRLLDGLEYNARGNEARLFLKRRSAEQVRAS
jgi:anti-sigma regulatory factor (Ser/Thr protein kinase)